MCLTTHCKAYLKMQINLFNKGEIILSIYVQAHTKDKTAC